MGLPREIAANLRVPLPKKGPIAFSPIRLCVTKCAYDGTNFWTSGRRYQGGNRPIADAGWSEIAYPAASLVTFKAARCMRSCRSINQKQILSWGQSCSRASRTRTNDASSGSSSRNSLRPLTASKRGATRQKLGLGLTARPHARASRSRCQPHRKHVSEHHVNACCACRP